jgi:hypothetical protein
MMRTPSVYGFGGERGLEFSADLVKLLGVRLRDFERCVIGIVNDDVVGMIPDLLHDGFRG